MTVYAPVAAENAAVHAAGVDGVRQAGVVLLSDAKCVNNEPVAKHEREHRAKKIGEVPASYNCHRSNDAADESTDQLPAFHFFAMQQGILHAGKNGFVAHCGKAVLVFPGLFLG